MDAAEQFESRYLKRMSTMLLNALDQAIAESERDLEDALLVTLETVLYRAASREEHREWSMGVLLSAHQHVWRARHGDTSLHGAAQNTASELSRTETQNPSTIEAYDARHVVRNEACQAFR